MTGEWAPVLTVVRSRLDHRIWIPFVYGDGSADWDLPQYAGALRVVKQYIEDHFTPEASEWRWRRESETSWTFEVRNQ